MQPTLEFNERVIAVVPETCQGPGWSNKVVWIHILNYATNEYRYECLQPSDITPGQWLLFDAAEAIHNALLSTVQN